MSFLLAKELCTVIRFFSFEKETLKSIIYLIIMIINILFIINRWCVCVCNL